MEDDSIYRRFRRRLFMRLYILPWLLLVLALCMFNIFVVYYTNHLYNAIRVDHFDHFDHFEDMSRDVNITGVSEVSDDLLDSLNSRFLGVINVSDVDNVSNVFSLGDYELSLSLGMDLESDLKRGILLLLDFHLVNVDAVISAKLEKDILDLIGRRFSGFKTYNAVNR